MDFVPGSSVGASSVSLLSGNGNLSVSGNSINAATPSNGGSSGTQCTAEAACGSVRVAGDAVSRVYFRVYMESPDASLWPTNGGEGWILGVSGETSDMVPTFSSMPTAIFEGQSYTGLTLTCANEGPNFARGATCQPTVSTGTISSLVCTPSPTVDVSHVGGSNEIECTFDYLLPDGNGSSSVTFEGQTGAVNDRNGGSVGAAGNNETTEVIAASAIVANNDTPAAVNGAVETVLGNVVANDTLNSVADPAIGSDVTLNGSGTAQDGTTSLGLDVTPTAGSITLNADGSVTVAAGTTAGSYVYTYEICEVLNPSNCDTATA
ncbi:hypothetical protein, partial [Litoreibacter albidus]|uniref:hypothetical protein n=1 Tax=Litoreibacter albidus TaxID=670155 RepID=UPI001480982C